jgi:DDE family transposase
MGTVRRLAEEVGRGLKAALPRLRKTVVGQLALAVGAMIEVRTPNTAELANVLPLDTERQDMREQWLRRLLKNPLLVSSTLLEPWARHALDEASRNGQTVVLSLDQTDLGDRFAVLLLGVVVGDRALPLAWTVEAGPANIGFAGQQAVLEPVRGWLPDGAAVLLLADRCYPSTALFEWLPRQGWQYRLRLKGNLSVDPGFGDLVTTGDLARGFTERYLPDVRRFASEVPTNLGLLHEAGHKDPWIIAMNCLPTKAAVRDYGSRWGIEPTFSDFKSRGFQLEATQLQAPDRLDRLLLIMALAMHWCVRAGPEEARHHPTPLEKKAQEQTDPHHWTFKKLGRSMLSGFKRGLRLLRRRLQTQQPLPSFYHACTVMRN